MAYSIDIISCITERFMALTATEKRIAQFILDDVSAAVELPIAELARLTQTSQASVTRFARALGCKDVRELKVKLAQSLAVGQRFILDVPDLDGVQGIYEAIISVLETHRRSLDMNAISRCKLVKSGAANSCIGNGRRFHYLFTGDSVPFIPSGATGGQSE